MGSKRKQYVLALCLAPVAALALQGAASNSAWANCTWNTGYGYTCNNTGGSTFTISGSIAGGNDAIRNASSGGGYAVDATVNTPYHLIVSSMTVTNHATQANSVGIYLQGSGGAAGLLQMDVNGPVTVTTAHGTGILINAQNGAPALMNVSGKITVDTTHFGTAVTAGDDGIEVTTDGGKATLNMMGATGEIKTNAGNGILVRSDGNSGTYGDVEAHIGSNVTIEVSSPFTADNIDDVGANGGSGTNNNGINIYTGGDGKINLTTDATIKAHGNYGNGIIANATRGTVNVTNTGTITVDGDGGVGIEAHTDTGTNAAGNVTVINEGDIQTLGNSGTGSVLTGAHGINAYSTSSGNKTGIVTVQNSGNISTTGDYDEGIRAYTTATGAGTANDVSVTTTVTGKIISTSGNNAPGIYAVSTGPSGRAGIVTVKNANQITTLGNTSDGIYAETSARPPAGVVAPVITIENTNTIDTTTGTGSNAIHALAKSIDGDVLIINTEDAKGSANGILAETGGGNVVVKNQNGAQVIGEGGAGVAMIANAANSTVGTTFSFTNEAGGYISGATAGVLASGPFTGGEIINQANGIIEADNDLAIDTSTMKGPVTITNEAGGTINGYMTLAPYANTFDNNGTWNLKNSKATSADAAYGTVARADMGDGAIVNNNKTGVINLVGISGPGNAYVPLADTISAAGRTDAPQNNSLNAPAVGGPVQGQILGVAKFTNAGTIDMTNGGVNPVGSVLVISGSTSQAWQQGVASAGGGEYVSAGGKILMNAVLNAGGAAAQSDVLVVDSVSREGGTGQTTINITNAKTMQGAYTPGDGIPVVEVLNKNQGASAPGAFVLALMPDGRPLTDGAYQYGLYQNGIADATTDPKTTNADGNWYLRSTMVQPQVNPNPPPQPPPPPPVQPPQPPGSPTPQPGSPAPPAPAPVVIVPNYRPEVPVYMTAPVLAQRMGLLMLGTYHHRVGEDRPMNWRGNDPEADMNADAKAPAPSKDQATDCAETAKNRSMAAWGRVIGQTGRAGYDDHTYSQFRENGPDYNFDIGALQAGFDVLRAKHDDLTRDNAGLYLGYMRGTAEVNYVYSNIGRAGRVDMNGYSLGGYWTHKGVSEWYLDGVLQGTRYDQAEAYSEYTPLNQKIYPNGYGLVASLEAGIPFGPREGWRWEPQAQLIYQYVTLDNGSDRYGWVEYGDTSTLYGRIGARLTKDWVRDQEKKDLANCADERKRSVWARVNLWHSFGSDADTTFTALNGMGATTLTTSMGDTWGQLGLGISGQLSQRLTAYLTGDYNMALTDGNGEAFSGEVGLRYEF